MLLLTYLVPRLDVNSAIHFFQIRDGNVLKGRYCESSEPISVTSDSNVIIVKFSSDSSIDYRRGFNATYQQITGMITRAVAGIVLCLKL